jgi:hypothetical protein
VSSQEGVKPTAGSGFLEATIRSAAEWLGAALLGNIERVDERGKNGFDPLLVDERTGAA